MYIMKTERRKKNAQKRKRDKTGKKRMNNYKMKG